MRRTQVVFFGYSLAGSSFLGYSFFGSSFLGYSFLGYSFLGSYFGFYYSFFGSSFTFLWTYLISEKTGFVPEIVWNFKVPAFTELLNSNSSFHACYEVLERSLSMGISSRPT